MRAFLLLAILSTVICVSVPASAATLYVDGSVSSSGDGTSWETALKTIQEGIDKALEGDTVSVAEGVYIENIHFDGKNIVLTSTGPLNPSVVANTIIDGNKAGSVVTFSGTETEACVLSGFTIRNGETPANGGGICGGTWDVHTHVTIENNTITGNSGESGGGLCWCAGTIQNNTITGNSAEAYGGGLYLCEGTIENNTITGNSAQNGGGLRNCNGTIHNNTITGNSAVYNGGGLYACNGTIQNNTITGNSAESGGGLYSCGGTIQNNTITGNSAVYNGGGLYACNGTIQNNTIAGNSAGHDGGGLGWCGGTIQNNTITGNSAVQTSGGLYQCNGTIQNNTITGNTAGEYGGGLFYCGGTIRNCIIWANTAPSGPQLHESSMPTYSCIQDWSGGGQGNIASEPRFLDLNAGDYRLQERSPCIDAGYNGPALPATDIAGMHRIMFGGKSLTVDMGAYEFHIWPPTENSQTGEISLKWSSLAGKTYAVYHSSDMLNWDVLTDNVLSAGDTVTTWIDAMGPVLPPGVRIRYYKVMENQ